jgi:hypothetical protein
LFTFYTSGAFGLTNARDAGDGRVRRALRAEREPYVISPKR